MHGADTETGPRGLVTSAGPRTALFGTAISQMLKCLCSLTLSMAQSCPGSTERVSSNVIVSLDFSWWLKQPYDGNNVIVFGV